MDTAVEGKSSLSVLSVSVRIKTCDPSDSECLGHCNVEAYVVDVNTGQADVSIGHIKLYRLDKAKMERIGPAEMWQQCQTYDLMHFGGKLNKIENFLANESFFDEWQSNIAEAEEIVYIEEVVLKKSARGQGLGLQALTSAIAQLQLPQKTILLLEPGGIGQLECSHEEAGAKLAKHWSKLGFRLWSYTDEAWLCVAFEELIVPSGLSK